MIGDYYRPIGGFEPFSLANAATYIGAHNTDATFITTAINDSADSVYGSGNDVSDGNTVASYLGTDAASLAATNPANQTTAQILANTLDGTIYNFTGYLAITASQENTAYTFNLGSDDGSALSIGGTQIIDNDGDHGFNFSDGGNTVEFTQAGLYAINVLYFV